MEIPINAIHVTYIQLQVIIFLQFRLYIQLNGCVLKAIAGRFMSSMLVGA